MQLWFGAKGEELVAMLQQAVQAAAGKLRRSSQKALPFGKDPTTPPKVVKR